MRRREIAAKIRRIAKRYQIDEYEAWEGCDDEEDMQEMVDQDVMQAHYVAAYVDEDKPRDALIEARGMDTSPREQLLPAEFWIWIEKKLWQLHGVEVTR